MLQTTKNLPTTWLLLGLSAHGIAAALLSLSVLCSGTDCHGHAQREAWLQAPADSELSVRVESVIETLGLGLGAPGYRETSWQAQVDESARALGPAALAPLRAVLEDRERPAGQRVAAAELATRLER